MALQEEFEKTGEYFFRWRSYLPLFMAVLFILALAHFRYPFADHRLDLAWDAGCLAVALLGQLVRFFTVGFVPRGTSGRNTKGQVADALNTTGMYAVRPEPHLSGQFYHLVRAVPVHEVGVVHHGYHPVFYDFL